jgi:transposase
LNSESFALLIEMPELGLLEPGQVASLAGLPPIARQALTMPALVATRFNPDLKAKYDKLIEAGKPAKVAITAIMRKPIVLANALLNANRKWTPKTA